MQGGAETLMHQSGLWEWKLARAHLVHSRLEPSRAASSWTTFASSARRGACVPRALHAAIQTQLHANAGLALTGSGWEVAGAKGDKGASGAALPSVSSTVCGLTFGCPGDWAGGGPEAAVLP